MTDAVSAWCLLELVVRVVGARFLVRVCLLIGVGVLASGVFGKRWSVYREAVFR